MVSGRWAGGTPSRPRMLLTGIGSGRCDYGAEPEANEHVYGATEALRPYENGIQVKKMIEHRKITKRLLSGVVGRRLYGAGTDDVVMWDWHSKMFHAYAEGGIARMANC